MSSGVHFFGHKQQWMLRLSFLALCKSFLLGVTIMLCKKRPCSGYPVWYHGWGGGGVNDLYCNPPPGGLSKYFGVTFWEGSVLSVFIYSPWSLHATAEADGNAVYFIRCLIWYIRLKILCWPSVGAKIHKTFFLLFFFNNMGIFLIYYKFRS